MKLFTNKEIYRFFLAINVSLFLLLVAGIFVSQMLVHDFKAQLLTHDYEIAGHLLQQGVNPVEISEAFTSVKTAPERLAGQKFLQTLGYKENMNNSLLGDMNGYLLKYRIMLLLIIGGLAVFLYGAFFLYFGKQQKAIGQATFTIQNFMSGDTSERIDSEEEGGLAQLFSAVNGMATSLNAHIEKEKHTKDFLKQTISDISHQLKTPLTALKMYNEIMEEENSDVETTRKFIFKSQKALEHMEILLQNHLKITRLDAGTITFNYKEVNIKSLIERVVDSFETRAEREDKTIVSHGGETVSLFCDAYWMIEALSNLVKNALDHTSQRGKIDIRWEESPAMTQIVVRDNGKGIHPEDIYHIFKRFYRSRFSQDTQGIGLGLSLVKSIVEAHNGTVTVESKLGRGSTFKLSFFKLTKS